MHQFRARPVSRYILVLVTAPTADEAELIAQKLLKKRLAACVNIVPNLLSIYRWKGKVERDEECMMIIKTEKRVLKKLEKRIKKMHSYEVPEILVFRVEEGEKEYLKWISSVVK
ncbi:periplasmic divalent cation tolerance protein CutA [Hydrogenimonas sp.]|nr:periplasmic divalent cation tolerance protein CutA [Hydrogenimonas sp.]